MLRGFRIISAVAAAVLAGFFAPLELQVLMCRDTECCAQLEETISPPVRRFCRE
jgi:hypothetical protein